MTVSSWGGDFQAAERKAFFEPAAATLGIAIKEDTTNGIADVRAQVMANAAKWDITEPGTRLGVEILGEHCAATVAAEPVHAADT